MWKNKTHSETTHRKHYEKYGKHTVKQNTIKNYEEYGKIRHKVKQNTRHTTGNMKKS